MSEFIDAPLLSIVVPIRNMQGRLDPVRNWLTQADGFNMQVIFLNDASVDETLRELHEIVADKRFSFVKIIDGNFGGPGPARNHGMTLSKGRWIAFWDSDDEPDVSKFIDMIRLADQEFRDIAVGGWISKRAIQGHDLSGGVEKKHNPKYFDILMYPGIWRWAFKVELARKSKFPHILMGEDLVFLANLKLSPRFRYEEKVYTHIQGNPGQLTSNIKALQDRKEMGKLLNREELANLFDLLKFMLRMKIRFSSFWHGRKND